MSVTNDEIRIAQARAVMSCSHDICACGQVTSEGQVVGDPLGEIGQTEFFDVLGMSWDQTTWDRMDLPTPGEI